MMRSIFGLVTALGLFAATSANAAEAFKLVADEKAPEAAPAVTALTIDDVCCGGAFDKLEPGLHEFVFIHPYTCCPVTVCVCVPCVPCECYEVDCGKGLCAYKIELNYKGCKNDVVIKFKKDGSVVVK
ncbi:MAG: hypothetical protein U1D30_02420 [Planctomycetota bacterium]